jgi:quinol monooxygenase YgiN
MSANDMVHVVAVCQSQTGLESELRDVLGRLVPGALKENGCLKYTLHIDRDDPCKFVFVECWQDRAAVDAHLATPESQELKLKLDRLLVTPADLKFLQHIA